MPVDIVTPPNYFTCAFKFAYLYKKQKQEAFPKTPSKQWALAPYPDVGRLFLCQTQKGVLVMPPLAENSQAGKPEACCPASWDQAREHR